MSVGLVNETGAEVFSSEEKLKIDLVFDRFRESIADEDGFGPIFVAPVATEGVEGLQFLDESIEYSGEFTYLSGVGPGEPIFALQFDDPEGLFEGGGTFSFAPFDDPGAGFTLDFPVFEDPNPDDGVINVFGGAVVDSSQTTYRGTETYDRLEVPVIGSTYQVSIEDNVAVLTLQSRESVFAEAIEQIDFKYGQSGAEETRSLVDAAPMMSIDPDDLVRVAEFFIGHFLAFPTIDDFIEWSAKFNDLQRFDLLAEEMFESSQFSEQAQFIGDNPSEAPDGAIQSFLEFLYDAVLGRAPDPAGLEYWTEELSSGSVKIEQSVAALQNGAKAETGGEEDGKLVLLQGKFGIEFGVELGNTDTDSGLSLGESIRNEMTDEEIDGVKQDMIDAYNEATDGDGENDSSIFSFPDLFDQGFLDGFNF